MRELRDGCWEAGRRRGFLAGCVRWRKGRAGRGGGGRQPGEEVGALLLLLLPGMTGDVCAFLPHCEKLGRLLTRFTFGYLNTSLLSTSLKEIFSLFFWRSCR